jgi:hypothetical protein
MFPCRHCGAPAPYGESVPRDAECASCGHDLRACVQCRHHDPAYHNACRETEADPVTDKERRNFCEFFSPNPAAFRAGESKSRQAEARARLEGLFGGGKAKASGEDARSRLESLFQQPARDEESETDPRE